MSVAGTNNFNFDNVCVTFGLSEVEKGRLKDCVDHYSENAFSYVLHRIWNAIKRLCCFDSDWQKAVKMLVLSSNVAYSNSSAPMCRYFGMGEHYFNGASGKEPIIAEVVLRALVIQNCQKQSHSFAQKCLTLTCSNKEIIEKIQGEIIEMELVIDGAISGNGKELVDYKSEDVRGLYSQLALQLQKEIQAFRKNCNPSIMNDIDARHQQVTLDNDNKIVADSHIYSKIREIRQLREDIRQNS